ncbi:uncharacterized protein RHIMIDRAFT_102061 [Rhizopus microsporus ATCC 52813]|uniref:Uncharacterized protein n=1 Tax=Rhizopus microsporus ATCC 52813 TaxID=1340429 RepID=A0A2G4T0D5_RHIZD|nr:uncharacterized protein RHIMIDRAFT_102061 [Rhizopus microsporus ATCC 52813]PHZ14479.1 hypothetical protein RHIMIDRAFT_102061 [Rhizopus microsporus ATCC 52813]
MGDFVRMGQFFSRNFYPSSPIYLPIQHLLFAVIHNSFAFKRLFLYFIFSHQTQSLIIHTFWK